MKAPLMHALVAVIPMVLAATVATTAGAAQSPKACGTLSGPTAYVSGTTVDRYAIYRIGSNCAFSRSTVTSILGQHLHNSLTPIRTHGASGWICIALEVDEHAAIAGHCVKGRTAAISWIGVRLRP